MTDTYTVTAKRWAHGWELHIDGIGVTQTGTLSKAEATAREYIAVALDIDDEKSFDVNVVQQPRSNDLANGTDLGARS